MQSGFGANKPIIGERDIIRHRNIRRRNAELSPDQLHLNLHLGQVSSRLDRRLEIAHRVSGENGAVLDAGWEGRPVSEDGAGGGDEVLAVAESDKGPPRLEVVKAVVEDREGGFETVWLVSRVGLLQIRRELGSGGVGVGEVHAVAGVRRRRRRRRSVCGGGLGGCEHNEVEDEDDEEEGV